MRGRPLIEWGLFLLVWGLLIIPLWRMSIRRAGTEAAAPEPVFAASASVWVRIQFSEPPEHFTLNAKEAVVWTEVNAEDDMERSVDITMADHRPELEVEAQWTEPGRRAIEVRVVSLDGKRWRSTLWSSGTRLRERLVFE